MVAVLLIVPRHGDMDNGKGFAGHAPPTEASSVPIDLHAHPSQNDGCQVVGWLLRSVSIAFIYRVLVCQKTSEKNHLSSIVHRAITTPVSNLIKSLSTLDFM